MLKAQEIMMNEKEWNDMTLYVLGLRKAEFDTVLRLTPRPHDPIATLADGGLFSKVYHFRDKMKETTVGLVCVGVEYITENSRGVYLDAQNNPVSDAVVAEYPTTNIPREALAKLFGTSHAILNKKEKKDIIGYVNRIIDYRENKVVRPTHQQRMAEMGIEGTPVVHPEPKWDIYGTPIFTAQQEEEE
jgi:hypothetical protein